MKAIIDKKSNLARGFADLNTPTEYEHELLFTMQERKETLTFEIEKLRIDLAAATDTGKINHIESHINNKTKSLVAVGARANKKVNFYQLLIARLRERVSLDVFSICSRQAMLDKKRLLSLINDDD